MNMIQRTEIYEKNELGETILIQVIEEEVEGPTPEQLIAEKEEQLLAIYAELQALKNNNG